MCVACSNHLKQFNKFATRRTLLILYNDCTIWKLCKEEEKVFDIKSIYSILNANFCFHSSKVAKFVEFDCTTKYKYRQQMFHLKMKRV